MIVWLLVGILSILMCLLGLGIYAFFKFSVVTGTVQLPDISPGSSLDKELETIDFSHEVYELYKKTAEGWVCFGSRPAGHPDVIQAYDTPGLALKPVGSKALNLGKQ